MPKPQGTCGATKMKILAIICQKGENGVESYGYDIWKTMKEQFHLYLNDNDIGNVYHHLNDLCGLNYVTKSDDELYGRCFYSMTEEGLSLKDKYLQYISILNEDEV